ncbi:AAA family ATPase [Salinicoccus sp. Marseille-QA3877]
MLQKIYYGPPGTGKSHSIDNYLKSNEVSENNIFRITFHPEYTYNDFVGQIMPVIEKSQDNNTEIIKYKFIDGVFTQALKKAYLDLSENVYLVIEEISRANSSAVLGDIFQLLDRHTKGISKGYSKYFITNQLIAKDVLNFDSDKVRLPPNLYILGTVNTSDQNVFVLDTAFKRRFEWEYVGTEPVKGVDGNYLNNPDLILYDIDSTITVEWVDFYEKLNKFITSESYLGLSEDKQIGQFFIYFNELLNHEYIEMTFKNKMLFYLWEDVHKASFRPTVKLFNSDIENFEMLFKNFAANKQIFSPDFIGLLKGE